VRYKLLKKTQKFLSLTLLETIARMLVRINIEEVLNHPFFENMERILQNSESNVRSDNSIDDVDTDHWRAVKSELMKSDLIEDNERVKEFLNVIIELMDLVISSNSNNYDMTALVKMTLTVVISLYYIPQYDGDENDEIPNVVIDTLTRLIAVHFDIYNEDIDVVEIYSSLSNIFTRYFDLV